VTLGVRSVREVVISRPISPGELVDTLFSCCPQDEPHIAVMQQELIIACSDLMSKTPSAFDGVLTIRLSWLADAITLLLNYVRVTGSRIDNASSLTPATPGTTGIPAEFKKSCIYDLSPTVVKDVVTALMTRKNWHLLSVSSPIFDAELRTPLQTRRLNGALNRMPVNFYDRVWTILSRSKDGIVIASQFLPQMAKYLVTSNLENDGNRTTAQVVRRVVSSSLSSLSLKNAVTFAEDRSSLPEK
ncbi:hypothetical protein TELCIR_08090, partial [Teladorsagia circumcincta]